MIMTALVPMAYEIINVKRNSTYNLIFLENILTSENQSMCTIYIIVNAIVAIHIFFYHNHN